MWTPGGRFCPCSRCLRPRYWIPASFCCHNSLSPATERRRMTMSTTRELCWPMRGLMLRDTGREFWLCEWTISNFCFSNFESCQVLVTERARNNGLPYSIIYFRVYSICNTNYVKSLVLEHYGNLWKPLKAINNNFPSHFFSWTRPHSWMREPWIFQNSTTSLWWCHFLPPWTLIFFSFFTVFRLSRESIPFLGSSSPPPLLFHPPSLIPKGWSHSLSKRKQISVGRALEKR